MRADGIEPSTFALSEQRSPTELRAQIFKIVTILTQTYSKGQEPDKLTFSEFKFKIRFEMQKTARIAGVTVIGFILRVLVIGFAIIFIYNYINPPNKIRQYNDSQRQRDLNLIADKLELYFSSNGVYPPSSGTDNSRQGNNCRGDFGNGWNTNEGLYQALVGAGFLEGLPTDPINKTGFCCSHLFNVFNFLFWL